MRHVIMVFSLLTIMAGSTPEAVLAEWPTDPLQNLRIYMDYGDPDNVQAVTDGAGGIITVWEEQNGDDIRLNAQRVDTQGNILWEHNGIRVCTYESRQYHSRIASDGFGGVYVVWEDETTDHDIFAQHVSGAGALLWSSSGLPVCTSTGDQFTPWVALNSDGGMLVAWTDRRNSNRDIYAQRFDAAGSPQWTAQGVQLCGESSDQYVENIVPDTGGGAIVAWRDHRGGVTQAYARRINFQGTPIWEEDGFRVSDDTIHPKYDIAIVSNDNGGAFISMNYYDYTSMNLEMKIHHIAANGINLWSGYGLPAGEQGYVVSTDNALVSDGQGGAIVVWNQGSSPSDLQTRAQRVSSSGVRMWTTAGVAVSAGEVGVECVGVEVDQSGGALVTWWDARYGDQSLMAQRLAPNGDLLWDPSGVLVNMATTSWQQLHPVNDGQGGLLCSWADNRDASNDHIYCQKVHDTGYLGDPTPTLTDVSDFPTDQGGQVILSWDASYLDVIEHRGVEQYSVWVRPEGDKANAASDDGMEAELVDRLGMEPEDVQALLSTGWNFVLDMSATLSPDYGCFAPTYDDSSAIGIPMAEYKVIAHGEQVWTMWESNILAGYSVDNLAPGAPLALTGDMPGGGQVDLAWEASGYHDEDLNHYAIYRGATAGFPLDEEHLVDTSIDPGYVDAPGGGEHFYRVTAVDAHGNESQGSNEIMVTDQNAVPQPEQLVFSLYDNHPNPFNPRTVIRFDLPVTSSVVLRVHDVAGHPVRTLCSGVTASAGRHELSWDGTDDRGAPVAAGVYFYRLVAGKYSDTRRMVLIK